MQSQSHPQARSTFGGGFAIYFIVLVLVAVAAFAAGRYIWQDNSGGTTTNTNVSALAPSPGVELTASEAASAVQAYTEMVWDSVFGPVSLAPSGPAPALTAAEAAKAEAAYTEMVWDYLFGTIPPTATTSTFAGTVRQALIADGIFDPMVWEFLVGTPPPVASLPQATTSAEVVDFDAIDHAWDADFGPLIYQEPTEAEIARAIAQHENAITAVLGQ